MVTSLQSGFALGYLGVNGYHSTSSRLAVPVAPSQYLYSNFRNVQGVPAGENTRGISINRLKIIDSLIESLKAKGIKPVVKSSEEDNNAVNEYLIKELTDQIRRIQAAPTPYVAAPQAQALAFNITL